MQTDFCYFNPVLVVFELRLMAPIGYLSVSVDVSDFPFPAGGHSDPTLTHFFYLIKPHFVRLSAFKSLLQRDCSFEENRSGVFRGLDTFSNVNIIINLIQYFNNLAFDKETQIRDNTNAHYHTRSRV